RRVAVFLHAARRGAQGDHGLSRSARRGPGRALDTRPRRADRRRLKAMGIGLLGILLGLAGLVWLSLRGWSVLVLAPAAALIAAGAAREALLADPAPTLTRSGAG